VNIVKLQNDLKDLSDKQLYQTMQGGAAPQYLVLGEMQRRKKMRQEAQSQPQQPSSVAEDIMAPPQPQGIAGMPQAPKVQMHSGGIVGFAGGKKVSGYAKGEAQACWTDPNTGKSTCPPSKPDVRKANTSKLPIKKMADGGLVGEDLQRLSEILKGYESSKSHTDMLGRVKKSKAGALGMMQVMPSTAAQPGSISPSIFKLADEIGVPYDREAAASKSIRNGSEVPSPAAEKEAARLLAMPELNIQFGDMYLQGLTKRYDGDVEAAAIAYNAGMGNADKWLKAGRDYSVLPRRGETEPYATGISKDYGTDSEHEEVMRQLDAIEAKEAQMRAERAANTPDEGIMQVLPAQSRPRPAPLGETVDRSGEATFDFSNIPGDSPLRSGPDLSGEMEKSSPAVDQSVQDYPESVREEEPSGLMGLLKSIGDLFGDSKEEAAPSNEDWVDPDTGYSLKDLREYYDEMEILNNLNKEVNYETLASFKEGREVKKEPVNVMTAEYLRNWLRQFGEEEEGLPKAAPWQDPDAPANVRGQQLQYVDDPSLDFTEPPAESYKPAPATPAPAEKAEPEVKGYPWPEGSTIRDNSGEFLSKYLIDPVTYWGGKALDAITPEHRTFEQRVEDAKNPGAREARAAAKAAEAEKAEAPVAKKAEPKTAEAATPKVSGFRKDPEPKKEGITGLRSDAEYFADLRKRMEEAKDPNKLDKALIAAGLTMAGSKKQDFLGMLAEGGLGGLKQYTQAVKEEKQEILDLLKEEGDIRTASAANEYKNYALMLKNQIEGEKQWNKVADAAKVKVIGELTGKLRRAPTADEIAAEMQKEYARHMAKYSGAMVPPQMPISKESVTLAKD
jgi:hypothetical protein